LCSFCPLQVFEEFTIRESENRPEDFLPVSPDLAICSDCKAELFNPKTAATGIFYHCTHCGPRFSIVRDIPSTAPIPAWRTFRFAGLRGRISQSADRRFHAQPVACPVCGPQIWYEQAGVRTCIGEQALQTARANLREGKILA
jgi:hydrogenase maturation protein HypF